MTLRRSTPELEPLEESEQPAYPRRQERRRSLPRLRPWLAPAAFVGCFAIYGSALGVNATRHAEILEQSESSLRLHLIEMVSFRTPGILIALEPESPEPVPPVTLPPEDPTPPSVQEPPPQEEMSASFLQYSERALPTLFWSGVLGLILSWLGIALVWRVGATLRRRRLGRPSDAILDLDRRGHETTLTGQLDSRGAAVRELFGGKPCVAVTLTSTSRQSPKKALQPSVSQTSDRLLLQVGSETVVLEGPLEVVLGSREHKRTERVYQLGRQAHERLDLLDEKALELFTHESITSRSLEDGQRIRVRGVLDIESSDAPQEGCGVFRSAYRQSACSWVMREASNGTPLQLAFEGTPRLSARPIHAVLGVAVGLVFGGTALIALGEVVVNIM